jgi:uncharacterized protein YkwD
MNKKNFEDLKQAVVDEHNKIRADPKSYIPILEKYLTYFKGSVIYMPGSRVGIQTQEGKAAVSECIEFLKKQKSLAEMTYDDELAKAAQDHASDIGPSGICGHTGTDGSSMDDRIERYLEWDISMAENIDFGADTAVDVIISLICDDGVSSRGHRKNIFKPDSKFIGVGIADHTAYRICTVIDYLGGVASYKNGTKKQAAKKNNSYSIKDPKKELEKIADLPDLREKSNTIKNNKITNFDDLPNEFKNKLNLTSNKGNKNTGSYGGNPFADDPEAPEDAVSCSTKVVTKKSGGRTVKKTTRTYVLRDGSQEVHECEETY